MIIDKKVKIISSSRTISKLKSLNINVKYKEEVIIPLEKLFDLIINDI
tara:strand:- start:42866 stop:43009 length:144 start_codon:yes stop_codon:yes gene_type:complete